MSAGRGRTELSRGLLFSVSAALAALALLPAAASAQSDSQNCTAEVKATQDPGVASIAVDCGDGNNIDNVGITTSERGRLREETGTTCSPDDSDTTFDCNPDSEGSLITAQFDADDDDVCGDSRLQADFEVEFTEEGGEPQTETLEDQEVSGCSDSSGARAASDDSGGDSDDCVTTTTSGDSGDRDRGEFEARNTESTTTSDDECAPEGGLDSGAGGTGEPAEASGQSIAFGAILLTAAVLVAGSFRVRHTRGRF